MGSSRSIDGRTRTSARSVHRIRSPGVMTDPSRSQKEMAAEHTNGGKCPPMPIEFSVFTKPWRKPILELGPFVTKLGFDAIELPVRPGYAVEPERVEQDLGPAARQLADCGVRIASIAGNADERTIAACADAGVSMI